jgi:hypothetical protein
MINISALEQQANERYNNMKYFLKCEDRNGNSDIKNFVVETCIKPTEDITPPAVTRITPPSNTSVSINQTELYINLYTNEPANCKWDLSENKNYESMQNTFSCNNNVKEITPYGWECRTTLNGLAGNDKDYYIKCMDKPWLASTDKEDKRVQSRDYKYTVTSTKTALDARIITPSNNEVISEGGEPFDINISVITSGGVEEGRSECKYSLNGGEYYYFYKTASSEHTHRFNLITRGNHSIEVECKDRAGNTAGTKTSFTLLTDNQAPIVTRAYHGTRGLTIITDEDSRCVFSTESCEFSNGNNKTGAMDGEGREHTVMWKEFTTYYVRCTDKYQNPATDTCSIIVKAANK